MLPKLNLNIADFLNRFLHFLENVLELNNVGQLRINCNIVDMVLPDVVFNKLPVPKQGELLL